MHRREVLFKSRFVFEVHVTAMTLVGPVTAVYVQVILQSTFGSERLQAHHALEGPDTHMAPDVSVEILFLCERLTALQTQEKLVHFEMSEIVLKVQKSSGTLWTLVPQQILTIIQILQPIHLS